MEGIKRLAEMLEGQKDKYLIIIVNHLMLQTEMNEAFLNEEKNLKDMATYIKDTAKKQAKGGVAVIEDAVVFKWATFIINQIIQNSIKYSKKEDKKIQLYAKSNNENIILYIKDNGIGIKKGEITRVFEKGFTGENGRTINKKSTGIGLYLCKKLCNKLGLGIELNSEKDIGTEVRIIFPKSSFMNL